ncbi:MAG: proprotein convertase P-domain-containing protein, partial [Fidelibacterota bacterium]
ATVTPGASGQLLRVMAPGATSGTFYYDDDDLIDWSIAATVSGDYLEVTIPYASGQMNDNGINYWYVEATNTAGTTRYPSSGNLYFTVTAVSAPVVSNPDPANGATVTAGALGQLLRVTAPGATSGTFYYDDDSGIIDYSVAATVSGDYLEVTIPYVGGKMTDNGTNYWYVEATNAAGTTRYPSSGNLYFMVAPGTANTYNSTDVPKDVTYANPTTTSTIYISASGTITDVNVSVSITHTYDEDVDIYLISPLGTRIELSTDNGSSLDNYSSTVFDDEASISITSGTPPFTGSYQPEGTLSTLDGESITGTWTLEVTDDVPEYDDGTLTAWSLIITSY